ncbi:MAG: hypothetical protein R2911_17260 [Caldilineaceae bacterium]
MKTRFSPSTYPNVTFWLCFFILNALLFLPLYWLNRDSSSFLPLGHPLRDGFASFFNGLLVWRDNFDPFRLNVEAPILVALWVHVGWLRGRVYRILFAIVYIIALIYYIYEGVALSMFAVEPVFYGQYEWFVDGATFLLEHMQLPIYLYIAAISGLIAAVLAIWALISAMLGGVPVEKLSRWSRMSVAIIALVALGCTIWFRAALANPMMAVSSLSYKLEKNVEESLRLYKDVSSFDDTLMREAYDYRGMDMAKKPNLYLIFIESYGSVLYKRPDYLQQYTALTTELDATLKEHGLHVKSTLSTAPTWGGGSWMSYTSAFMGMRINEHPEYLTLFDKYQTQTYPDLGYYLKSQGYQYYRLAALSTELSESSWQKYMNFYKADEWIRYHDLDYTGPGYGWGPAPPDQYTINKAHELITQKTDGPFALFYITQNSHYPWIPHPTLVDDWHTLNQVPDTNDKTDPEAITHRNAPAKLFQCCPISTALYDRLYRESRRRQRYLCVAGRSPAAARRGGRWLGDTAAHHQQRPALYRFAGRIRFCGWAARAEHGAYAAPRGLLFHVYAGAAYELRQRPHPFARISTDRIFVCQRRAGQGSSEDDKMTG